MTIDYHPSSQPDILEVIADLSNDEVRTPPSVANAVLDLLPEEVWSNPELRWLDPGAKTGVFLREIAKRLMVGLESLIPDEKERLAHILRNQVFGIAITELTALMARRTLYCSKDAAGERSVVEMPTSAGNIWFGRTRHLFAKGRCSICGAAEDKFDSFTNENYAYAFIHEDGRIRYREAFEMRFDVVVGNPPYQMDDVGGHRPVPIYHRFVTGAIELQPRYIAMITPSRWMAGGLGLTSYRQAMLADRRFRELVDFPVGSELFPDVEVKGGISYFLWDREYEGRCNVSVFRGGEKVGPFERDLNEFDVFVRDARAIPILRKVLAKSKSTFQTRVASVRPFGDALRSNFKAYSRSKTKTQTLELYMNVGSKRIQAWVDPTLVTNNRELIRSWKIFLPKASSDGGQKLPDQVLGKGFVAGPGSVCTETYLAIGPFTSEENAENALHYLENRFARFMVSLRKPGQDSIPSTFAWLPDQNFDVKHEDSDHYAYFGISKDEIAYINQMVKGAE